MRFFLIFLVLLSGCGKNKAKKEEPVWLDLYRPQNSKVIEVAKSKKSQKLQKSQKSQESLKSPSVKPGELILVEPRVVQGGLDQSKKSPVADHKPLTPTIGKVDNKLLPSSASPSLSGSEKISLDPVKRVDQDPELLEKLPFMVGSQKLKDHPGVQKLLATAKGKVQVIEFFSYGCHGCAQIDPALRQWVREQKNMVFTRVPVIYMPHWVIYAKIYHAIEALAMKNNYTIDRRNGLHADFFQIVKENPFVWSELEDIYHFFIKKNLISTALTLDQFSEFLDTFEANIALQKLYNIQNIPTFVVQSQNGVFLTSATLTGKSEATLLSVVTELLSVPPIETY